MGAHIDMILLAAVVIPARQLLIVGGRSRHNQVLLRFSIGELRASPPPFYWVIVKIIFILVVEIV